MADTILITCPECKIQQKGPAALLGKRVKCKSCGSIFTVKATPPGKVVAASPKKSPTPKGGKARSAAAAAAHAEDEEGRNPYQISDVVLTPRCPQCAAEMESEDAVICLNCGYNTQTRMRMHTLSTYATTPLEWMLWLAPGILCVLTVLLLLGFITFLWLPVGADAFVAATSKASWNLFMDDKGNCGLWVKIWGSVFAAAAGYVAGRFAVKRLIFNPTPPEKIKRGGGSWSTFKK